MRLEGNHQLPLPRGPRASPCLDAHVSRRVDMCKVPKFALADHQLMMPGRRIQNSCFVPGTDSFVRLVFLFRALLLGTLGQT